VPSRRSDVRYPHSDYPVVGYTGEEISSSPVIRGGEHGFFVEQTIPLGGQLGLSRSVFQQEVTQAEALADTQRQRVANAVRMRYYDALTAARRVEVAQRLASVTTEAMGGRVSCSMSVRRTIRTSRAQGRACRG
jgi:outer membrane protein TolC